MASSEQLERYGVIAVVGLAFDDLAYEQVPIVDRIYLILRIEKVSFLKSLIIESLLGVS